MKNEIFWRVLVYPNAKWHIDEKENASANCTDKELEGGPQTLTQLWFVSVHSRSVQSESISLSP